LASCISKPWRKFDLCHFNDLVVQIGSVSLPIRLIDRCIADGAPRPGEGCYCGKATAAPAPCPADPCGDAR